ncbi:fibroblast growth factor 1 isoform X1 [Diachasma alloeum]|uniref:fibroblast growth factor 1 isoform X1 n=1 Tax=Diachasma alloeum TaxID=454923 RepID=UPI00073818B9|nr:fibroblast growth factor 1 isoform X1 [Diachasma alloeum]XP_015124759.1 fibroblast growth factor 1 isoform X1 [Diachasma alloeum]
MSLRWIQENRTAPTCDEESSDIENSGTDDSYDTDLSINNDENDNSGKRREKRNTTRHSTTTVTFDENGTTVRDNTHVVEKTSPCLIWDPRTSVQNPAYQCRLIKLFCRTGYHLTLSPAGRVCGQTNIDDQIALFNVSSVSFGVIRIQNPETGHFLAFNKKGHLYGELKEHKDTTEWEQWSIGSYEAFRSHKYAAEGWWIGIKKNGRPKAGPKTAWGQKAIQFLVIGHQ